MSITDTFVLVLVDPDEGDLLGIWGPYSSEADANAASQELQSWPLSPGSWEVIKTKKFPVETAVAASTVTYTTGRTTTGANYSLDFYENFNKPPRTEPGA